MSGGAETQMTKAGVGTGIMGNVQRLIFVSQVARDHREIERVLELSTTLQ